LGEGTQAPSEQSNADRLERRTGNLWQKVRKHRSNQRSGKALFGFGQSGSGHQHVQELSTVRRGAYAFQRLYVHPLQSGRTLRQTLLFVH